jgi:hypothetical protein
MQAPYGPNARLVNQNMIRQGLANSYPNPESQQQQQSQDSGSFDWLNALGLGALAAGLGGLGYAAYKNRGRFMPPPEAAPPGPRAPMEPPSGPKPPEPSMGPSGTRTAPMADPWLEAAVNQPRPSAPRPISVDEGRPSGVRTVNLNPGLSEINDDYLTDRALGLFLDDRSLHRGNEIAGTRRVEVFTNPNTGKQVTDFIGATEPLEASRQTKLAQKVAANRQAYISELQEERTRRAGLRSQADQIIADLLNPTPVDFLSSDNLDILSRLQQGENYRDVIGARNAGLYDYLGYARPQNQANEEIPVPRVNNINLDYTSYRDRTKIPNIYGRGGIYGKELQFEMKPPHAEAMESGIQQDALREMFASRQQQEQPRGGAEINISLNSQLGIPVEFELPPKRTKRQLSSELNIPGIDRLSSLIEQSATEGESDFRDSVRLLQNPPVKTVPRLLVPEVGKEYLFVPNDGRQSRTIDEETLGFLRNYSEAQIRARGLGEKVFGRKQQSSQKTAKARAKRQEIANSASLKYIADATEQARISGTLNPETLIEIKAKAEAVRRLDPNPKTTRSLLDAMFADVPSNSEAAQSLNDLKEDFESSLGQAGLDIRDIQVDDFDEEEQRKIAEILGSNSDDVSKNKVEKGRIVNKQSGIRRWSPEIKNEIFSTVSLDDGTKILRIRPEYALQVATDEIVLDNNEDTFKVIGQALVEGEQRWNERLRGLRSALRTTTDLDTKAEISAELQRLNQVPLKKRASMGIQMTPELEEALDTATKLSMDNLFNEDINATIATSLIEDGEIKPMSTKGQGYTGDEDKLKGTGFGVNPSRARKLGGRSSTNNQSDYVQLFTIDGQTGTAEELDLKPGLEFDANEMSGQGGRGNYVTGYEPRGRVGRYTFVSNAASGKPEENLMDPDLAYASGKEYYGRDEQDYDKPDYLGQYVGGVRGFYKDSSKKEARLVDPVSIYANPETGEITSNEIAQAVADGILKVTNGKNGSKGLMYVPPTKLMYRDSETLKNADNSSFEYRSGISEEGMPYKGVWLENTDKNAKRLLMTHNANAQIFNETAENINKQADIQALETSRSIIPNAPNAQYRDVITTKVDQRGNETPIYGQSFASLIRDNLSSPRILSELAEQYPELISKLGISQQEIPKLFSVVDPKTGERVPVTSDLSSSGGARYTQFRKTQAPNDVVNTGLSLLIAAANDASNEAKRTGIYNPINQRRLGTIPSVYDKEKKININPRTDPDKLIDRNADEYVKLLDGTEDKPGLVGIEAERNSEEAQAAIDSILDELLKTGDTLTEKQKRKFGLFTDDEGNTKIAEDNELLETLNQAETVKRILDRDDDYYSSDIANAVALRPEQNKSSDEQIISFYENLVDPAMDRYGSGFFPIKGTAADALDYDVAVPIEGSPETYQYQKGGRENLTRTLLATQLAQLGAQNTLGTTVFRGTIPVLNKKTGKIEDKFVQNKTSPTQISSLNTALEALQKPRYKFAGTTPIELKALIDSSTIGQISRPGYKINVVQPGSEYDGNDSSMVISGYTLDKARQQLSNAQTILSDLDSSDPKYTQAVNLVQKLQQDVNRLTPKNNRPNVYIPVETDPELYQQRFGGLDLDSKNQRKILRVLTSLQSGGNLPQNINNSNIYANEVRGNNVSVTDANAVLGNNESAAPSVDVSQATQRPGGQKQQSQRKTNQTQRFKTKLNSLLQNTPLYNIQNPGGDLKEQVAARQNQLNQVMADLNKAAQKTPGGTMLLSSVPMQLGRGPGNALGAVTQGGRVVGLEPIDDGSPAGTPLALAQVLRGPRGMTATQTISEYGRTPGQLQRIANAVMSQAKQNQNRQSQNQQALQNYATQQLELLDSIPQGKYNDPLSKVIDYNLQNVSPEGRALMQTLQKREAIQNLANEGRYNDPANVQLQLPMNRVLGPQIPTNIVSINAQPVLVNPSLTKQIKGGFSYTR